MEMGQAWDIIWRDEVTAKDRVRAKALSIVKKVNFKNGINTEHTKPIQEEKWIISSTVKTRADLRTFAKK